MRNCLVIDGDKRNKEPRIIMLRHEVVRTQILHPSSGLAWPALDPGASPEFLTPTPGLQTTSGSRASTGQEPRGMPNESCAVNFSAGPSPPVRCFSQLALGAGAEDACKIQVAVKGWPVTRSASPRDHNEVPVDERPSVKCLYRKVVRAAGDQCSE